MDLKIRHLDKQISVECGLSYLVQPEETQGPDDLKRGDSFLGRELARDL